MDLRQLRYVVKVAQLRSFSRAAAALHISQPALSRQVADFEAKHGSTVFDRTGHGVVPRPSALAMLREAEALLDHAASFARAITAPEGSMQSSIAFGVGPLVAGFLPPVIAAITAEAPRIRLQITIESAPVLVAALERGQIEFGVFSKELAPRARHLSVEPIGRVNIGYVARRGHPLAGRRNIDPIDLVGYPLGSATVPEHAPVKISEAALREPTIRCEQLSVLEETLRSSDMICRTSPDALGARIGGDLVVLDVRGWATRSQELALIASRGVALSPLAQRVVVMLRARLSHGNTAGR